MRRERPALMLVLAAPVAVLSCALALGACGPFGRSGADDFDAAADVSMQMWALVAEGKSKAACRLWNQTSLDAMADLYRGGCSRRLESADAEFDIEALELAAEPQSGTGTVRVRLRAGKSFVINELIYMDDPGWLLTDYEVRRIDES